MVSNKEDKIINESISIYATIPGPNTKQYIQTLLNYLKVKPKRKFFLLVW